MTHPTAPLPSLCPRCDSTTVELLTAAPLDNAWLVYLCSTCCYSWRSTEPEEVTDPDRYDPRFKIDPTAIGGLAQMPPIPPLRH